MRTSWIVALVAAGLAIGLAFGQDGPRTSSEPSTAPPPRTIDADLVWNFNWHGKLQRGRFLELLEPEEGRGRTLVITQLELRMTRSTRVEVVEHRKEGKDEEWKKVVRRGDGFSVGWVDSTTQWVVAGYAGQTGMRFGPNTRPGLEITLGGGELYVYAEGYWSRP